MTHKTHLLFTLLLCFTFASASEINLSNTNIPSDGTGETYISSTTYKNKKVKYVVKDNLALFEGDIVLGTVDKAEVWRETKEARPNTTLSLGNRKHWSNGIVPYTIDADVSIQTKQLILQIMRGIQAKIRVSFIQRTSKNAHLYTDYINIVSTQPACWSEVGRTGGAQEINIVAECKLSGITHEFEHALGLFHQQSSQISNTKRLQAIYGTSNTIKRVASLQKSSASSITSSTITFPTNNQKVLEGRNITLRWKNNGATIHYLIYYTYDKNHTLHRIFNGKVSGTSKILNIPKGFADAHISLVSYNNKKYIGNSLIKLLPKASTSKPPIITSSNNNTTVTSKPSMITFPTNNMTVSSKQSVTLKWKSFGADKHTISLGTVYNGKYGFSNVASNISGTSKTIQMPTFFKSVDIILTSFKNGKRLGTSKVHLLPNTHVKGPTEFTSPLQKNAEQLIVVPGQTLTVTWKNHGATRNFLLISAFDKQGNQRDLIREFVVSSGSKSITVPDYARSIATALYSLDGVTSLGIARQYFDVIDK